MADDTDRKLLEEVAAMRRRLDEITALLEKRLGLSSSTAAVPAAASTAKGAVADLLDLSEDFVRVITALVRMGASTPAQLANELREDEAAVRIWLTTLVAEGQVTRTSRPDGIAVYERVVTRTKAHSAAADDIWKRLEI